MPSMSIHLNDELSAAVIGKIKNGDRTQLAVIYRSYRSEFISWLMNNYHCSREEAKDAYQVSVGTLYQNIMNNTITELKSSVKTYIFAIGKNKILEEKKESSHLIHSAQDVLFIPEISKWENEDYEKKLEMVESCLIKLGEPCRTLLELFYYHDISMDAIAEKMHYKNSNTTKNLKHKCLMRLRKIFEISSKKIQLTGF
jgi:RNA polymerase sigma factor (sigma-70 family)